MDVFVGDLPVQPPAAIQWRSGSLVDSGAADAAAVCAVVDSGAADAAAVCAAMMCSLYIFQIARKY